MEDGRVAGRRGGGRGGAGMSDYRWGLGDGEVGRAELGPGVGTEGGCEL